MASAWGMSWGLSWGNSWGPLVQVDEEIQAGAGHPTGIWWGETKIKKGKKLDDILKKAMQKMIEGEIELEPEVAAAKAVEIVKPFVEKQVVKVKSAPEAPKYRIDWAAIEKDAKRVQELLALWQEQLESLEDEEMLLMMMANC